MREFDVERVVMESIANTPIGKDVVINFGGNPSIIDITMTFKGGWVVTQTILPGKPFVFTKGEEGYLESLSITINPYEGLKNVEQTL